MKLAITHIWDPLECLDRLNWHGGHFSVFVMEVNIDSPTFAILNETR